MRNVPGILLYVVAGVFVYTMCILAFVNQPPAPKWGMMAAFSVFAGLFLGAGLGATRFRRWMRDCGIVLLSAGGTTAMVVLSVACMWMSDEVKPMMKPDTVDFFGAYATGICFTLAVGGLGVLLLVKGKKKDP